MKVDLSKSGVENILALVRKSSPVFRGTPYDTGVTMAGVLDHPSECNTVCELVSNGTGVYAENDSRVLYYNRRAMEEYIYSHVTVQVPSNTSDENVAELVRGAMSVSVPEIREHVSLTNIVDPLDPLTGIVRVRIENELSLCIDGYVDIVYRKDAPESLERSLFDDVSVVNLDGFGPIV